MERWASVPGLSGIYEVSDCGRVRSCKSGRITSVHDNGTGYLQVSLRVQRRSKMFYVHRLVLVAFVGEPLPGMECDHVNRNKHDNRLGNLRWCTHKENVANSNRAPVLPREQYPFAKLSYKCVRLLRCLRAMGAEPGWVQTLASTWGIHKNTLIDAATGKTWKDA